MPKRTNRCQTPIGILLFIALLASTAAATTENKEMPTEKEVTAFIDSFKVSGDFANSAYDAFIKEYPAGHCDIWSNGMISLYFYDPDSPKEYGSIYLDNTGKEVKPSCGPEISCIKSYKGEAKTEVKEEVKEEPAKEEVKEEIKEEPVKEEVKEEIKEEIKEEPVEEKEVKEEATEEKEVTEDQKAPEEVKEETEDKEITEVKEEAPEEEATNDDKIQSIMKFFKTGDMSAKSLEKCLYYYFGND